METQDLTTNIATTSLRENTISSISLNDDICATTNSGSTITIDTSWLSTGSGYYSYSDGTTYSTVCKESIKEEVEKYLDNEDEMMPIVKNYLRKYLEKVMDNPGEIVKEALKEKDQEIEKLREEVKHLKKIVEELDDKLWRISPVVLGSPNTTITTTSPYITWIGGSDTSTTGDYSAGTISSV